MNIKILASLTISFLSIAASLFFFGVIAPQLISIIIAALTACLAAIFTTMIIAHVVQKQFQHLVYTGKLEHILPYINYGANVNHATNLDGDTPLHLATKNNHADIVLKLIQAGANINAVDQHGSTALYFAAAKGHTEIALALIKKGANPNAANQDGSTALYFAAAKGYTETVEALIDKGANPNATDRNGNTPLHFAANTNVVSTNLKITQAIIQEKLDYLNGTYVKTTEVRDSQAHIPIIAQYAQTIEKLIAAGANIHVTNDHGETPLHEAAKHKRNEILVSVLIDKGANPNAANQRGYTPLHLAVRNGHTEIVLALIENGANINAIDQGGSTALHWAAQNGHIQILSELIKKGANPNTANWRGHPPLHLAAQRGHAEIVLALIENGANPNATCSLGTTPLYWAARSGHTKTALALIENGADVNNASPGGTTPLHYAAANACTQTALALIENGANIDAYTDDGDTPLHLAARAGHTQTALALIQAGTRVNATNQFSHTPLCLAVRAKRTEVAIELIKKGANINTNINNRSLLFWTIRENDRTTTLAIIHYGKVPYTNIPVIEGNPTSDYIQRQYQRAQKDNSRYAKRLFCCMQPDYGDIIRLQIQIWAMITKDTNLYRKIRILLRNALPTDLLHIVLQYAGLLPSNLNIDLDKLIIKKTSSTDLEAEARKQVIPGRQSIPVCTLRPGL